MTDSREQMEYEVAYPLAEIDPTRLTAPPESRQCSQCGDVFPAEQMTIIKHHHARQPLGHLRMYCPEHAASAAEWAASGRLKARPTGPVCPSCFVTVPSGTGICDMCGQAVTAE